MAYWALFGGILLLVLVLADTFETIILPRTVARPKRFTNMVLWILWRLHRLIAKALRNHARESWLSGFGPLALVFLIVCWAGLLILGFALVQEGLGTPMAGDPEPSFGMHLYLSATTFFTLGLGDVAAVSTPGRTIAAIEAGVGFGFLALVIGYLPVLYQSFSRREATILLLDARAGSPPAAGDLLCRHADDLDSLRQLLRECEQWSAQLLESYLSYPILAYYRSQHERLTWLASLTAQLDACSVLRLGFREARDGEKR